MSMTPTKTVAAAAVVFGTALSLMAGSPRAAAPAAELQAGQGRGGGAAGRAGGFPGRGRGNPTATLYEEQCSGCHGTDLAGGRAPSLFDQAWLNTVDDQRLVTSIENGIPNTEMEGFKQTLTDEQVWSLVQYIRNQADTMREKPAFVPDPNGQVVKSEEQTFKIEVVAGGIDTPWGLEFLPDGRLIVTERSGGVRLIKDGQLSEPIKNTPKVHVQQDGGMLDVGVPPNYAETGWIYLAYAEDQPGYVPPPPGSEPPPAAGRGRGRGRGGPPPVPSMTVWVRGKINANNEWVDQEVIYRAPADLYTTNGAHYGSRFLFDDSGHVFFSIGERGVFTNAQNLSIPLGKIHRVNLDGSIPQDNPFVGQADAIPSIWTYGHRNPQGLAWDPVTGLLWESEHGPNGGDEINIIEKGHNYGWGEITMGTQNGITKREAPGMEQPIVYYTPTIAPSGINFYTGDKFPKWKNNLFVAALRGEQLRRLVIDGRKVTHQEVLFEQFGRVRDVVTGPDGYLYALLQNPTGGGTGLSLAAATPGAVIRLVPAE